VLLVTQLSGFDHLHREHVLYAVEKGKLREIWSFSEPGQPMWPFVEPVTRNGRDFLVFWRTIPSYEETMLDTLEIKLLDAGASALKIASLPTREFPIYAVWIASCADAASGATGEHGMRGARHACALLPRLSPIASTTRSGGRSASGLFGPPLPHSGKRQKYQDAIKPCAGDSRLFFLEEVAM
jgi:hypothetical protein